MLNFSLKEETIISEESNPIKSTVDVNESLHDTEENIDEEFLMFDQNHEEIIEQTKNDLEDVAVKYEIAGSEEETINEEEIYEEEEESILDEEQNNLSENIPSTPIPRKRKVHKSTEIADHDAKAKKNKLSTDSVSVCVNYMCSSCMNSYPDEKTANEHIIKFSNNNVCKTCRCDGCSVLLSSEEAFRKHISFHFISRISHMLNYFDCTYCNVAFGNEIDYDKHAKCHTDDENFIYKFEGRAQIDGCEILPREVHGDDIWGCGHCDMQFGSKNDINFHLTLFHANLICPFDKQPYLKSVFYLANHLKTKHADQFCEEEIEFSCPFCNRSFQNRQEMNNHTKECDEKKFSCNHCEKKFALERQLKEHLLIVKGDFKYSCSACNKLFTNKAALTVHARIHTMTKPYICTFEGCNKTFRTNSHRSSHFDTHSETKNFKCQFCDDLFQTRGAKRIHEKSHSEENICKLCDSVFKQRSHYVRHVNSVHKIKCDSSSLEDMIKSWENNRNN